MQNRYSMFRRGAVFYCEDRTTGQQKSLLTRDEAEAQRIIRAKNDAVQQPLMNMVLAKTYLAAQDPKLITRTWSGVMQMFCERVVRTRPMQFLRDKRLVETTDDDFSTRSAWAQIQPSRFCKPCTTTRSAWAGIPPPILPRKRWPKMQKKIRRAITATEHETLLAGISNAEWRLYLCLHWFTGANQTDAANLTDKNVDWTNRVVVADGAGVPLGSQLASARPAEVKLVESTLARIHLHGRKLLRVIADRAYDSDPLRERLLDQNMLLIAPHRRGRTKPAFNDGRRPRRYRKRWKIERTLAWLGNYRRLVVRYGNHLLMYQAFFHVACSLITLRYL